MFRMGLSHGVAILEEVKETKERRRSNARAAIAETLFASPSDRFAKNSGQSSSVALAGIAEVVRD
jgi:hypothetical protein